MSGSRALVFAAMRAAGRRTLPAPASAPRPAVPADLEGMLAQRLAAAGGVLRRCEAGGLAHALAEIPGLAEAAHLWSALPLLASRGCARTARDPRDLDPLAFTVLAGAPAVAENGAVWNVPASPLERAAALLAEHLVLVVPEGAVVATLHDLYEQIDASAAAFGWLLAGPSKTADIEQALVFGAHGPRACTVVLARGDA
jgi:L-lactate dehydrogenase complex protein LldG